jgi:hypothetical protein
MMAGFDSPPPGTNTQIGGFSPYGFTTCLFAPVAMAPATNSR